MDEKLANEVGDLRNGNAEKSATLTSSYKIISKFGNLHKGTSSELDQKIVKLRKLVAKNVTSSEVDSLLNSIFDNLNEVDNSQRLGLKELNDTMRKAGEQLQSTKGLDDKVRRELRMVVNKLKSGVSIYSELHPLVIKLLTIFQQAKNNSTTTSSNSESGEIVKLLIQGLDTLSKEDNVVPNLHDRILKIKGADNEKDQIDLCLKAFYSIIDQFSQEFKQTQKLVLSINSVLAEVQSVLVQSLENSKQYDKDLKKLNVQIDQQIKELSKNAGEANSFDQLQSLIDTKLQNITESIKIREQIEQKRANELNSTLSVMETKLSKMEERTTFYRGKWLEEKARSETDALTGLPNRGAYDKRFDEEFQRWTRTSEPLCLAVVDIDHFKKINDKYGHSVGDKTLQIVAKTLRKSFRATDYIARYGGEEFACLLIGTDPKELMLPLEKVRKAIESIPFVIRQDRLNITISIGVTALVASDSTQSAFERADKALYEAKATGRNKICYKNI